jgi:membrane protease YdiL (CAAX protease family)
MLGMQAAGADVAAAADPAVTWLTAAAMLVAVAASATVALRLAGRLRRGLPAVEPRIHPPATWSGADVVLVALGYVALVSAAGTFLSTPAPLRLQLLADLATKVGATLLGVGVLRAGGASWAAIGCGRPRWREDLGLATGGLALMLAPLLAIAALLDRIVPYTHPVVSLLQKDRDPVAIGLVVASAVVVAPVAEEFFFRRVLQGWLETRLPQADGAAAVGLAAAAFAAAHLGHGLAAAPLFGFGLVMGAIARATGALLPCVLAHALFNAVGVTLLLAAPGGPGG